MMGLGADAVHQRDSEFLLAVKYFGFQLFSVGVVGGFLVSGSQPS